MMSGPHFEQLRTRLKGLGLGRVGMKKLKNLHKGRVVRKFRIRECVVRKFRTRHYSPAQMQNWILSNGHNFFVSNPNRTLFEALDS